MSDDIGLRLLISRSETRQLMHKVRPKLEFLENNGCPKELLQPIEDYFEGKLSVMDLIKKAIE